MNVAANILVALLALTPSRHGRVVAVARTHAAQAQPRAIALDVHGPAPEASTLRATLQELTTRRGLAFSFEAPGEDRDAPAAEPWATLSVELGGGESKARPAVSLREGAAGRVRLHRVVPGGASLQVTVETLATIAYTALETLALEEAARPIERPSTPRPRAGTAPGQEHEHAEQVAPEPETAPEPARAETAVPPQAATAPVVTPPAPDAPAPPSADAEALVLSSRASAAAFSEGAGTFPVTFSLASFAGYQAGNLFTSDRRTTSDAWGMGVAAAGAVPRWPLQPALGLGLGAWYGTGREPSGTTSDGSPRPVAGARLQGQAEFRLTLLHYRRFSAALGPWVTLSRATYEFGTPQMGQRGPGPNQGPPNQGPDPNANDSLSRATHTEFSAGLAARFEAQLGGHLALYCTIAGAAPLTARPIVGDPRQQSGSPNDAQSGALYGSAWWTLSTFAGLSFALTDGPHPL